MFPVKNSATDNVATLLLATCMTLQRQNQCQINPHIVFGTQLATRLEIIMEVTKQALWKLEFLKAGTLFQKYLSTDEPAKFI